MPSKIEKENYTIITNKFPDGIAGAIRQPIDYERLEEDYPDATFETRKMKDDTIAIDYRFVPQADGEIAEGVQLVINTLNGTQSEEGKEFKHQTIQYIMTMEKFEDLFSLMKKMRKNMKPNLFEYNRAKAAYDAEAPKRQELARRYEEVKAKQLANRNSELTLEDKKAMEREMLGSL